MLYEVIVERVRGCCLQIGGGVAWPSLLDGPTVSFAEPAGPVECGLQGGVLGVVLLHAPELARVAIRRRNVDNEFDEPSK